MMNNTKLLSTSFKALVLGAMSACFSVSLSAQEAAAGGSQAPKFQPPVVCAGYKPGKSNLVGERAGKKVQKAFEAYQADNLDEAILILRETKTSEGFDRAYVNKFLGNLIASKDDGYREALKYLAPSVEEKFLNDGEHAATLKMVADLSLSLSKYNDAIKWYNKWLDFTCKNSGEVHLRIATAYYEMEQYDKVVAPSDKAIQYTPKDKLKSTPYQLKLQSYSERKQYKNALRVAEDLVLAFPTEGKWWTMLGAFYMQNEQYKKALSTYEMASMQNFLEKESHYKGLSQLYSSNDIPYAAAITLEKFIKQGKIKPDERLYGSLANSFHASKSLKKAAFYYGKQADISNDPDTYRKQGTLLLMAQDYSSAIKALKKSLDAGSDNKGRINLAIMEAYFYQNKFREAYTYVKRAAKFSDGKRTAKGWKPYIERKMQNRNISF